MKKLSLKDLKLGEDELLQREQLKTVFGGFKGGYDSDCNSDNRCSQGCSENKFINGDVERVCSTCCIA